MTSIYQISLIVVISHRITKSGQEPLHGTPVKDRDMRAMVKRRAQKVGLTKDVHPHMLRHTFATDLYRVTKDIRLVQKTLGHADLSTTMIYTHLVDDDVAHAMRTFRQEEQYETSPD